MTARINRSIQNLVIGSSGFVGTPLCNFLEAKGESVIRFDLKNSPCEDAREHKFDFSKIDRVYFLAWDVGGSKYIYQKDTQLHQLDWNLSILTNVMRQLQNNAVPFLFVSSQLVSEHDTVYGATKRLGEVWSRLLNGGYVRLWNVYGPIEHESIKSHVVSDFIWQAVTKKEIKLMTTGEEIRQFIHIDDVCRAFHIAQETKSEIAYDVTSLEWTSVYDLAQTIAHLTGARVIRGEKIGSTQIPPTINTLPNWKAAVPLEDGLSRMIKDLTTQIHEESTIDNSKLRKKVQ